MDIDIRKSIINNFKNSNTEEIKESIESSIQDKDEITLPGLGVFFELLWENSNSEQQQIILEIIQKSINEL
ncbi:MAG: small acid-soluble spore protein SspI [Bacilli bacterium]|nr:small acid-soluble spore protein SspI [Bacilli bacterium]